MVGYYRARYIYRAHIRCFGGATKTGYEPGPNARDKTTKNYLEIPYPLLLPILQNTMTEYFNSKHAGKIEKLGRLNSQQWANRMRAYLVATGPLQIVLGDETRPPPGDSRAANNAYQTWLQKEGQAQCALLGSCTPTTAIHIENLRSPMDMWRALAGVANSAETEIERSLLYRRFTNTKAISGEPLSDFFGKLQKTVGLLAGTDHAIPPH